MRTKKRLLSVRAHIIAFSDMGVWIHGSWFMVQGFRIQNSRKWIISDEEELFS